MKLQRLFRIRKSRKYPIKRDSRGQSLRARCFQRFDEEKRPVEVAKELGMKESAPDRNHTLDLFARACGISKEDLETILTQPHGLRRLMTGKFYFPRHADDDRKRQVGLEVALFISDHLIKNGGTVEDVRFAFEHWMKENQQYREEEEADIKEENQEIAFMRKVIEAADKAEQQGRVKCERLTAEERNAAIRYGLEAKMKLTIRRLEKEYWFRIGELMGEGLGVEQARARIYQDLLEKGDMKGAKAMRQYQDIIHPMKANDQTPPPSTSQRPSPV